MLQNQVAELEANPTVSAAEVQELWQRVRGLGADASIGSVPGTQAELQKQMGKVLEMVADLQGEGPKGTRGCTTSEKGRQGSMGNVCYGFESRPELGAAHG